MRFPNLPAPRRGATKRDCALRVEAGDPVLQIEIKASVTGTELWRRHRMCRIHDAQFVVVVQVEPGKRDCGKDEDREFEADEAHWISQGMGGDTDPSSQLYAEGSRWSI